MASPQRQPAQGQLAAALDALRAWLAAAVGEDVRVSVASPSAGDDSGLTVWPLALLADQEIRGGYGREPLRLRARYLVAADGPAQAAAGLLDLVLQAAARDDAYHVVFEPVPAEVWLAASMAPRAALQFDVPIQVHRVTPDAPRVRAPIQVDMAPLRALQGSVLGPGGVPLADISVTVEGGPAATRTDDKGNFVLAGVPATATTLVLSGKGLRLRAEVPEAPGEPVVINCDV
ncbi:MAG TPA: carboxypeptidase-like regulatory domain-containing protein [Micromonosporaceae bacterium]|jgi:hypothetical protein|nr:carboxypeptidase-like regulatory domain-containing protein [Micromonosporaceae bacterium]